MSVLTPDIYRSCRIVTELSCEIKRLGRIELKLLFKNLISFFVLGWEGSSNTKEVFGIRVTFLILTLDKRWST